MKVFLGTVAVVLLVGFSVLATYVLTTGGQNLTPAAGTVVQSEQKVIRGVGFVRGPTRRVPRNKFAMFATKVHIRNQSKVKTGDVIFEYDDLDLRTNIAKLENSIAEQQNVVAAKQTALELTKLDPLPSAYRNTEWKIAAAKKRLERLTHELEVYKRLYRSKGISELALREKAQSVKDAEADVLSYTDDLAKVKRGLADIYIRRAECELAAAELKLKNLERELELVREQRKYYRMVATIDGTLVTNSDTVPRFDPVATEIAAVHRDTRKDVYVYFDVNDIHHVLEGKPLRFRSNTYDCDKQGFATIVPYKVTKWKSSWGDRMLYLVECKVTKEPVPLRLESTGVAELFVN